MRRSCAATDRHLLAFTHGYEADPEKRRVTYCKTFIFSYG